MRFLRFALCVACLPLVGLHAQEKQDEEQKPVPEEIPNFNQLDEFIYVPKSTLSLGTRLFLNGPKTTYAGQGAIPSGVGPLAPPDAANVSRTYMDGYVAPDSRTTPTTTGDGSTVEVPIAPDGRTNSWSYDNASQVLPNGDLAFHIYSGEVTDTSVQSTTGQPSLGLELILDRDMGNLGKHFKWAITAGLSIADIHSSTYANVATTLTTVTDTYDLFGQVPPAAPFTSPNTVSQNVLNSSGQPVTTTGSANATQTANEVILLGNRPLSETTTPTFVDSTNRYFIEGAYYTLRVGPTLILPVGQHFRFTLSAGPDLVYSGSEYNVLEDLVYATNEPDLTQLYQKENSKLLPGYYVDANLRYDLNDTTGFYVGGIYQGSGAYSQSVSSGTGTSYTTRIDFQAEEGLKTGMTVRF